MYSILRNLEIFHIKENRNLLTIWGHYKTISKPEYLITFTSPAVILWTVSVSQKTAETKRHLGLHLSMKLTKLFVQCHHYYS